MVVRLRAPRVAFTLVELFVGLLLASIVIALVWRFFASEQRRARTDNSRLSGLQGAMQLDESLAWDLERLVISMEDQSAQFNFSKPVEIAANRLEFRMTGQDVATDEWVRVVPVVYFLDQTTGRIHRRVGADDHVFSGLLVHEILFSLVSAVPQGPAIVSPADFTFGASIALKVVKYTFTCFSEDVRAADGALRKDADKVTLVGAVALPFRSDRTNHPYWRPVRAELLEGGP